MESLKVWTCQRAENLKKLSKILKNNYAATMASAARRQIGGGAGGGAPINKRRRRRRPQIVGGGAARPAHGSTKISPGPVSAPWIGSFIWLFRTDGMEYFPLILFFS